ncbi:MULTISPECIES: HalOD1 output domain-containing protein [Natrialbaceae]|uniref:HalOD1 output domain-containing protein n=1 Tax=Natrialbaceae TaxID=1644061 RepID=UPI00207D6E84|nr:HalOD1 output domain-containing protein [Natronococcus sp. CG52]
MTDAENRRPSTAIIDLVARVDGVDPIALEPLYNAIDPDKLDSICDSSSGFQQLSFSYEGRTVTVETFEEGLEISLADAEYPGTESAETADIESSL